MKAVVLERYGRPDDVLKLVEVETPTPGDNDVLVNVRAAAVNDWDWGLVRGKPFYIRLLCGFWKPRIRVPGVDIAGQVETVGRDVRKFKPGDEVYGDLSGCGFGGFGEQVCVPDTALALKPAAMTFVDAAAIPHAAMLAIQGLLDVGQLQPGQKVLINGAGGGVGTYAVQIAKPFGVELTGVDSAAKLEMMRSLGYDHVIDYAKTDFTKAGQRYDLILDTRTTRSPMAYTRALRANGMYVTVGGTPGRLMQTMLLWPIIRWITGKSVRLVALKPNKDLDYVKELFEAGNLKTVIDGPYPLSDIVQAITLFGEARHQGKVVIKM